MSGFFTSSHENNFRLLSEPHQESDPALKDLSYCWAPAVGDMLCRETYTVGTLYRGTSLRGILHRYAFTPRGFAVRRALRHLWKFCVHLYLCIAIFFAPPQLCPSYSHILCPSYSMSLYSMDIFYVHPIHIHIITGFHNYNYALQDSSWAEAFQTLGLNPPLTFQLKLILPDIPECIYFRFSAMLSCSCIQSIILRWAKGNYSNITFTRSAKHLWARLNAGSVTFYGFPMFSSGSRMREMSTASPEELCVTDQNLNIAFGHKHCCSIHPADFWVLIFIFFHTTQGPKKCNLCIVWISLRLIASSPIHTAYLDQCSSDAGSGGSLPASAALFRSVIRGLCGSCSFSWCASQMFIAFTWKYKARQWVMFSPYWNVQYMYPSCVCFF